LEIKQSSNPFFVTNSSTYGMTATDFSEKKFEAPAVHRPHVQAAQAMMEQRNQPDFSFMYKKESEVIGEGVSHSDSGLSATFLHNKDSIGAMARAKREGLNQAMPDMTDEDKAVIEADSTLRKPKVACPDQRKQNVNSVLAAYQHQPKGENPLYTTSNNDYGKKMPTAATFTAERESRLQKFSNTFNGLKYRDQGLNTSIAKSRVHSALDPQFI